MAGVCASGRVVTGKQKGTRLGHGLDPLDDLQRRAIGAASDDDIADLQPGLRIDRLRNDERTRPEERRHAVAVDPQRVD